MNRRSKKILIIVAFIVAIVFALFLFIGVIASRQPNEEIIRDLTAVGEKVELFKADNGHYPTREELETVFSSDPRYVVPQAGDGKNYATGLSMTSNFFYCKQDNPSAYVVLAAENYDYAVYISNKNVIKEYDLRGVKPEDRPNDYPFSLHATAGTNVCPVFLPNFTDSANGYGDRDGQVIGWARWTGIRPDGAE